MQGVIHLQVRVALPQTACGSDSLFHDPAFDGHQGVVDFDKVIFACVVGLSLLQVEGVEVQLDDVAGVRPQLPLDEGVGGIRGVGEAGGIDLSDLIGFGVLLKSVIT